MVEVPSYQKGGREIPATQEMFASLLRDSNLIRCNRYSLTIQGPRSVEYIQPFNCDSVCKSKQQLKFDTLFTNYKPSKE